MTVVSLFTEHAQDCPFCGTMLARHKSGFAHPGDHRDESCPMNGRAIRNLAAWNQRAGGEQVSSAPARIGGGA